MSTTKIQWTDETWNPVTGCTKVSAGCKHCYAEGVAKRFWKDRLFTDVRLHPDRLDVPLRWRKPRRVFVNSMSDLFREDVPNQFIADVFDVMQRASQHTFQILTKRPERMRDFVKIIGGEAGYDSSPPNVWLGVSVEDQATADERIPLLLNTPAAIRFLSCEPLLGPINLEVLRTGDFDSTDCLNGERSYAGRGGRGGSTCYTRDRVHWLIVGGESGPGARPCDIEWVRSIVRQCREASVPVFVKQLGAHAVFQNDVSDFTGEPNDVRGLSLGLRDRKGGDPSEWPKDLRVREWPS